MDFYPGICAKRPLFTRESIIGGNEEALKIYEMKNLNQAIKDLIMFKLTHPETEAAHGR